MQSMSNLNCPPTLNLMEEMRKHKSMKQLDTSSMSPLGALKRSNSHNALFNELVLQVPIKEIGDERDGVDSEASTTTRSAEHEVQVWDPLLETSIPVSIRSPTTIKDLKDQIQMVQGRSGLRIIPSHVQVITIAGRSDWSDSALVFDVLDQEGCTVNSSDIVVEPLVTELISFFLASVNNLDVASSSSPPTTITSPSSSPARHLPLSSPKSDSDSGEWGAANDFFLGGMEMEGQESPALKEQEPCCTASPPSSAASPSWPSASSPPLQSALSTLSLSAPAKPVKVPRAGRVVSWLSESHAYPLLLADIEQPSDAVLSARVTPSGAAFEPASYCASYEGASVLAALYEQRDRRSSGDCSSPKRGVLDVTLLRTVGNAGDAYATQSHLVMRNPEACLPLLQRLKLGALEKLVLEVQSGLRHGQQPEELEEARSQAKMDYGELVGGCTGGTYLMRNAKGKPTAIFKPMDEEPYAPANPKGYTGSMDVESDMRSGIPVGGGAARECAAYLLDHGGFASVPSTAMLRISHSTLQNRSADAEVELKVGSLQRFEEHECTVEDVGTSSFPVDLVHAIGLLDVRAFNMDRNSDNILYVRETRDQGSRLVPIDHGYILPSIRHLEEVEVCWLHWPQAKQPFSERTLAYIAELDAEADMQLLRSTLALSEESLLTLFLGTTLLKAGAAAGLSLHDIGKIMMRERYDEPSAVEAVVAECLATAQGDAALRALVEERVAGLVHRRWVGQSFNRMGQSMHRRTNSATALDEVARTAVADASP